MVLAEMAEKYCKIMSIEDIPEEDIQNVIKYLRIGELPRLG